MQATPPSLPSPPPSQPQRINDGGSDTSGSLSQQVGTRKKKKYAGMQPAVEHATHGIPPSVKRLVTDLTVVLSRQRYVYWSADTIPLQKKKKGLKTVGKVSVLKAAGPTA